jgi:hypothetical protein
MTPAEIKSIQARIGTEPDGVFGAKSRSALQVWLKNVMPKPHPFPTEAGVSSNLSIFGRHGDPDTSPPTAKITIPFKVYYEDTPVQILRPHEKVADSLLCVFQRLDQAFPTEAEKRLAGILTYDGLYNPRQKRGGNSWSMHSWAIAIDLDADRNGNLVSWPEVAVMPLLVMECFAREGWLSAGAFWGRDAMHFQATRPS